MRVFPSVRSRAKHSSTSWTAASAVCGEPLAGLTRAQKLALKAVIEERGRALTSGALLRRCGLGSSTMLKALKALEERDLVRLDQEGDERVWRVEGPFLGTWLRMAQAASAS